MSTVPLQSAQRKLFDVANSLGLSDSVLKVIDRRQKLDKQIVYGGMVGHLPQPSGCCLPLSAEQELLHLMVAGLSCPSSVATVVVAEMTSQW